MDTHGAREEENVSPLRAAASSRLSSLAPRSIYPLHMAVILVGSRALCLLFHIRQSDKRYRILSKQYPIIFLFLLFFFSYYFSSLIIRLLLFSVIHYYIFIFCFLQFCYIAICNKITQ